MSSEITFRVNDVTSKGELETTAIANVLINRGLSKTVDAGGVSGDHPPVVKESMAPHAFLDAALLAFHHHRPLVLKPSHVWLMVAQGVATHVKDNAEALRDKWVMHDGKKELIVCRDGFLRGQANDWAGTVPEFVSQIRAHTVAGVADLLTPRFSTTTEVESIACGITVMDACQKYFDYSVYTRCGYPSITLDGAPEDWEALHANALTLIGRQCLGPFAESWSSALESVLSRITLAAKGMVPVDVEFWQSMCKRGGQRGSGGYSWINGWVNVFLPFMSNNKANGCCVPYRPDAAYVAEGAHEVYYGHTDQKEGVAGIPDSMVPSGLSSAPVKWVYLGTAIPLLFQAGFIGVVQDKKGRLCAEVGWAVTEAEKILEMKGKFT